MKGSVKIELRNDRGSKWSESIRKNLSTFQLVCNCLSWKMRLSLSNGARKITLSIRHSFLEMLQPQSTTSGQRQRNPIICTSSPRSSCASAHTCTWLSAKPTNHLSGWETWAVFLTRYLSLAGFLWVQLRLLPSIASFWRKCSERLPRKHLSTLPSQLQYSRTMRSSSNDRAASAVAVLSTASYKTRQVG